MGEYMSVLFISEQGPCDCCGPDVERRSYPNTNEARQAAERYEGGALNWTETGSNAEYEADSRAWYRHYCVVNI